MKKFGLILLNAMLLFLISCNQQNTVEHGPLKGVGAILNRAKIF